MNRLCIVAMFSATVMLMMLGTDSPAFELPKHVVPGPEDVVIYTHAVKVPQGRILLIRKGSDYGAVKFTEFWKGKTEEDMYARYESYYQGDKSGDFSKDNVKTRKGKLSQTRPRGIGRFAFSFGNPYVKCGRIKVFWSGNYVVYFDGEVQDEGDYVIELAPTKWTDISQVNAFDNKLKWYRYDPSRTDIVIPVEKLW